MKRWTSAKMLVAALWCLGLPAAWAQGGAKEREAALIAILGSNAEFAVKADACRELARVGTIDAVPALASLLGDEKLSHMARYGLEPIPGPAVDTALRAALGSLKGRPLVGVIGSIGVRRDAQAVPALSSLLKEADEEVAQGAARALGAIATPEAAAALRAALEGAAAGRQLALCEGLFRCAEAFTAQGGTEPAVAIYDLLRALPQAPHQVRAGGWRGAILGRGADGISLLLQALRDPDPAVVAVALRVGMEMEAGGVTQALAGELGNSPAARQLQLANVLGRRADAAALPALLAVARSGEKEARVAAITALAEIGSAEAAVPLTGWLKDPDADVAKTAATALAGLPGEQVNAAVIGSLEAPDPELRHKMLELVRERRIAKALPVLLKMMDDPDGGLRLAAIRSYADLAGASGLGSLLAQVLTAAEPAEIDALEKALGAVCAVAEQPQECGKQLAEALPKAGAVAKPAILRTLRLSGGPAALAAVRGAVGDPEKEVHNAAIRVLSEWKSADAAPMLLYLAQNSTQPVDKILCLRGYLGMATQPALPLPQKLTICRESAKLIERDDEKRLLLGALASAADAAGLDLAVVYLDDAAVKREAVATVMAIAEKRPAGQHVALARAALDKVVQVAADNPPLVQRAQELLKAIEAEPK